MENDMIARSVLNMKERFAQRSIMNVDTWIMKLADVPESDLEYVTDMERWRVKDGTLSMERIRYCFSQGVRVQTMRSGKPSCDPTNYFLFYKHQGIKCITQLCESSSGCTYCNPNETLIDCTKSK